MTSRIRAVLLGAALAGVLAAAGPAPDQHGPPPSAPAGDGSSAAQSFSRAWEDLKSSAVNAWHGLRHGTNAAVAGVQQGWQTTKERAATPSDHPAQPPKP